MPDVYPHDLSEGSGFKSVHNLKNATSILDRNIEKAEIISMQLKAGIKHHKEKGMNVDRLEILLLQYDHLIEKAKKDNEANVERNVGPVSRTKRPRKYCFQ